MFNKINTKDLLSSLWVFLTVNYIFCDVFTLMYSKELTQILAGNISGIEVTQEFLLAFAVIMQLPMLMIVLSKVLKYKYVRVLSVAIGALLTLVQAGSLFAGDNSLHYIFFSIAEITTTILIVFLAIKRDE